MAVSGCQKTSAPAAGNSAAQPTVAANPNWTPATNSSVISVAPATIATCGPGVVAVVHWDAQNAQDTTASTEVWVGSNPADANLTLFTEGGNQGQSQTGPWTSPGTHFVLKDKSDGKVLGDAVVGGLKCP